MGSTSSEVFTKHSTRKSCIQRELEARIRPLLQNKVGTPEQVTNNEENVL